MNIDDLKVGDRVLLQSGRFEREQAQVKALLDDCGVLLRLSDGHIKPYNVQYILKVFK